MGQQLKYGCEQLPLYLADLSLPRSQVYLAVYNADFETAHRYALASGDTLQ